MDSLLAEWKGERVGLLQFIPVGHQIVLAMQDTDGKVTFEIVAQMFSGFGSSGMENRVLSRHDVDLVVLGQRPPVRTHPEDIRLVEQPPPGAQR